MEDVALVVCYTVENVYLDRFGQDVGTNKKREKKKIKLQKMLKASSNAARVAGEVMKKCKYIHESKREYLEGVIKEMQHELIRSELRASTQWGGSSHDQEEEPREGGEDEVDVNRIEEYIELLYEGKDKDDVTQKIEGTAKIIKLCIDVDNLEHLIQEHTLMGALTRVLNEEYKKSVELNYNIMRAFLAFSNFSEMHPILGQYRVGNITLKIVELEVKRLKHRLEEKKKRQAEAERRAQVDQKQKVHCHVGGCRPQQDRDEARMKIQAKHQDKLLFVSLHVLINLAEDSSVERKMIKRNLVEPLVGALESTSANLLYLAVSTSHHTFSLYTIAYKLADIVVNRLVQFIPCSCEPLVVMTMRLVYNLSFDPDIREQLVKAGVIPKLVELLKKPPYRARGLRILYHMSITNRCKSLFAYTDAIPIIMQLIVNFPQKALAKELAALAVNVSLNSHCAELMVQHKGLQNLVDRISITKDPMVAKIVRNISQWTYARSRDTSTRSSEHVYPQKGLWAPVVEPLLDLAVEAESHDLLVELLGTLGQLTELDLPKGMLSHHWVDWGDVMHNYDLAPFLCKLLVPGMAQTDVILEVVVWLGQMVCDKEAAAIIGSSNVIPALQELWASTEKSGDVEVRLQLLHTFWQLMHNAGTRLQVMSGDDTMEGILNALSSRHGPTREAADRCLRLVLEFERDLEGSADNLVNRIRQSRFRRYNRKWLEVEAQESFEDGMSLSHSGMQDHDSDDLSRDDDSEDQRLMHTGSNGMVNLHHERLAMDVHMLGGGQSPDAQGCSWDMQFGCAEGGSWEEWM
ncbi:unnamed protein product [Chrysoparadoxa australica]